VYACLHRQQKVINTNAGRFLPVGLLGGLTGAEFCGSLRGMREEMVRLRRTDKGYFHKDYFVSKVGNRWYVYDDKKNAIVADFADLKKVRVWIGGRNKV
jgi:hypothetical protein